MQIFTPIEVAEKAGNKYLGVLVAAKFARFVNDFPRDRSVDQIGALEDPIGTRVRVSLSKS